MIGKMVVVTNKKSQQCPSSCDSIRQRAACRVHGAIFRSGRKYHEAADISRRRRVRRQAISRIRPLSAGRPSSSPASERARRSRCADCLSAKILVRMVAFSVAGLLAGLRQARRVRHSLRAQYSAGARTERGQAHISGWAHLLSRVYGSSTEISFLKRRAILATTKKRLKVCAPRGACSKRRVR